VARADATMASVDRALRVLLLLEDRGSTRVIDVAEHLGVARSTAHRVLTALAARRFVVQDAHHVYHRGPALSGLDRTGPPWEIRDDMHKPLEELAGETGETCHIAVLEGNGARFVDGVESRQPLRVGLRTGLLLPAHTTAIGKVLLAGLSRTDFLALYPRGLPGEEGVPSRRMALERELSSIRRTGWASNLDESGPGISALAVPVVIGGRTMAALAVASPTSRCPSSRHPVLIAALTQAAAAAGPDSAFRNLGA
jgi:DNA-binding IclR family transcriptional regulator